MQITSSAARGLDIPDVDWVIQFDPPQDPNQFTHRCGRTARFNKTGRALVFLQESQDTYINFLKIRKVPISEFTPIPDTDEINYDSTLQKCRQIILSDRDVWEKSNRAFVSWARSYMQHQASFIFRWKDVDIADVGYCFGLLKLPKMPELKGKKIEFNEVDFNVEDIKFACAVNPDSKTRFVKSSDWLKRQSRLLKLM